MDQTAQTHSDNGAFPEIREAVRRLCAEFPGEYGRALGLPKSFR